MAAWSERLIDVAPLAVALPSKKVSSMASLADSLKVFGLLLVVPLALVLSPLLAVWVAMTDGADAEPEVRAEEEEPLESTAGS